MDPKQFEAMLSDAETRLRRLKTLYDQWFIGMERTEPAVARRELDDLIGRMRKEPVSNTALRFRLQQLVARQLTYATQWRRIARQIEEGTYQRDVQRARNKRARDTGERQASQVEVEISYEVDLDFEVELQTALEQVNRAVEEAVAKPPANGSSEAKSLTPEGSPENSASAVFAPPSTPPDGQPAAVRGQNGPAGSASLLPAAGVTAAVPGRVPAGAVISPFALPRRTSLAPASSTAPHQVAGAEVAARPSGSPSAGLVSAAVASSAAGTGFKPSRAPIAGAYAASQAAVPPRPATGGGALSTHDVQRIYSKYLAARKQNAERTDNVRLETIEKRLRGMLPRLEKKHAGKRIDFEVVLKDGRVALKPVAK